MENVILCDILPMMILRKVFYGLTCTESSVIGNLHSTLFRSCWSWGQQPIAYSTVCRCPIEEMIWHRQFWDHWDRWIVQLVRCLHKKTSNVATAIVINHPFWNGFHHIFLVFDGDLRDGLLLFLTCLYDMNMFEYPISTSHKHEGDRLLRPILCSVQNAQHEK